MIINLAGLSLVLDVTPGGDVRLLHLGPAPEADRLTEAQRAERRLVEVQVAGENTTDVPHGRTHTGTLPGSRLILHGITRQARPFGERVRIALNDPVTDLQVTCVLDGYANAATIRAHTEVTNGGTEERTLTTVSSFVLADAADTLDAVLHIPGNTWYGESQWTRATLRERGLRDLGLTAEPAMQRIAVSSTGSRSSVEHLPIGIIERHGSTLAWQIETPGSWHWELGVTTDTTLLLLSGPSDAQHCWTAPLAPGESFTSVPVAVTVTTGTWQDALRNLTTYRRVLRRPHADNTGLPVIFNDYMNCLWGDPSTERLRPLITAAAAAGCEYFCIDAGWYADGDWWSTVGEWQPSPARFPGGIAEPLRAIRDAGMIPGLWLEIEVMGVDLPFARSRPDDWFLQRNGKRVVDRSRFQLDFRHPDVRAYADTILDRLVNEYGAGYLKMDYNIDVDGDGLLEHQRAYLHWLDDVLDRHPALVIENCASGGLRMDYAMLARHSIQSTSDQTDYRRTGAIAAATVGAVTPEQAAVWTYPLRDGDREEVVFNMVNTLLTRVHQSGHLAELTPSRQALVAEAISVYKSYRAEIPAALPFWPLGRLAAIGDDVYAFGLDFADRARIAVWRNNADDDPVQLELPRFRGREVTVRLAYPSYADVETDWEPATGLLSLRLPGEGLARLIDVS